MTEQTNKQKQQVDLAAVRERLASANGKSYWRSLEEVAETPEFQEFLNSEFPEGAPIADDAVTRRTFLKLMGASLALAGLTACGPLQPEERIIPYVVPPPEYTPGIPLYFATTALHNGYGRGVVVESHEHRPTHIAGNRDHPASLGAADVFTSAEILNMYDPDRSQTIRFVDTNGNRQDGDWQTFVDSITPQLNGTGEGLAILTGIITSPTFADQMSKLLEQYPDAKWYQYEPVSNDNVMAGSMMAFDEYVDTIYSFDKARIVLSLDANFMEYGPGALRYARDFINKRRVREEQSEMNRLYMVEATHTITGTMADHRAPIQSNQVEDFARIVASRLGVNVGGDLAEVPVPAVWTDALIEDLESHRGESIIIAGPEQPPAVHALAHAMNEALGNVGETVNYIDPVQAEPVETMASFERLVREMGAGNINMLVILGGNPVYTTPSDLDFVGNLGRVATSVHLSLFEDETSTRCTWHIPQTHFLEMWGDARAYDGTASIIQPMIAPLYGGKSPLEMLGVLMGEPDASAYDMVRTYWNDHIPGGSQKGWEEFLQAGVVDGTASEPRSVTLKQDAIARTPWQGAGFEINFRPDSSLWDGSYTNNSWLMETPRPLTKMTWDNVVMVSPFTAQEFGFNTGDLVDLSYGTGAVRAPVWVTPGHADNSVTVHLGYGRRLAGQVGNNVGFNAYLMRTSEAPWFSYGLEILNTGQSYKLASTQLHQSIKVTNPTLYEHMMERIPELIRVGTIEQFRANPEFAHMHGDEKGEEPSLYPDYETAGGAPWKGHRWGMVIDLNACIGCNACVVACQAENNIPVVGKDQVLMGREMHWIRIDRYYQGNLSNPNTYHQPLGCVQCERAPCEVVCPVAATSHSLEGLNDMTYNRCVGTRYCSNNCPYKVRRFNFFNFNDMDSPTLKLMRNPDVTVRERGVMEKCSYCVQRINLARIVEKREGTDILDGTIQTACEAACPTQAITFGDMADETSRVAELKDQPHNYSLLGELNTVPRTTYLVRLRNPNPMIEPPVEGESHGGH